jgi:hypothetical protein
VTVNSRDHPPNFPGEIRLQESFPISPEEYSILETGLDRILARPDRDWNDRLVAGEVFLGMLADYLRATASREEEKTRGAVLEHYVNTMAEESNDRLFQIAARIRPNRSVRRFVLSLFHAFTRSENGRPPGRIQRICDIARFILEILKRTPTSRHSPVPDEAEARILIDHVRRAVSSGGLLLGPSSYFTGVVRRNYAHLLISVALILREWIALPESMPHRDALLEAVRTVERNLQLNGADDQSLSVQERIGGSRLALHLLDLFIHRKDFARSMVGE